MPENSFLTQADRLTADKPFMITTEISEMVTIATRTPRKEERCDEK